MRYFEYAIEAFHALMRNKTRSILTLLGIVIGVAAVDAVYGLSSGAERAIDQTMVAGNVPNLTISVDPKQANPAQAALQYADAARIAAFASGSVQRAVPFYSILLGSRREQVRSENVKVTAFGFSWQGDDEGMKVLAGSGFSGADVASASRVCMLSRDLAEHLYGGAQSAIGRTVTIGGSRFQVVGVPNPDRGTGANYFGGSYYFVLPYTTYHNAVPGNVDGIYVWLTSPDVEAQATRTVKAALARLHGPHAVYQIASTRDQLEQSRKVLDVIAIGLTSIGAISLLVAGIGIMNIMLVTVTERTREIGIRKAIGARRGEIVLQFLTESGFLSVVGGIAGLLLSVGVIALARPSLERSIGSLAIPWARVVLSAFVFSLGVGLLFGVYPAARASRLDPVEALRS